jgi:hypothetical protein
MEPAGSLYFPATIFLSAFLLFQVQPIMGRYILPWFGGGPTVWTSCMLFFQMVLLAGYGYAHWLGSRRGTRRAAILHISLLGASLLFLPIAPRADAWRPVASGDPSGRIVLLLAATLGGPYLMLSATGPLLQRWFNLTQPDKSPWRLYALSNLGSFLALLSYPFAVEPFLRLRTQASIWSVLYAGFAVLCGWAAWRGPLAYARGSDPSRDRQGAVGPPLRDFLFWLGLSSCGSILLLATTNQISHDIAVSPLLWIAPLSVYLLTFILAFDNSRWYRRALFAGAAGLFAPVACAVISAAVALSLWWQLGIYLVALFITCMICHGELAISRPPARHLTAFYLTIATGGAMGGAFVALIAPRVFTEFSEYPIGLAAACLLGFVGWLRTGALKQWTSHNLGVRVPLMALLLGGITSVVATVTNGNQPALASVRNFYGILRVSERSDQNGPLRQLTHGRIQHGFQYLQNPQHTWPTSYYGPNSGAGLALTALQGPRRVAIVGLGTGTLAAWGRPGDTFRFYEINPAVESIARTWFSFLKDSQARTEIVLGDGRLQLERELASGDPQEFDMIAVDAFSSDVIPVHLLTAECGDIYRRHLKPGGLLLLHISNRSLNLERVARGLAEHLGWKAVLFFSGQKDDTGESTSRWVLITANTGFLQQHRIADEVSKWTDPRPPITWTDDFSSVWHVLKF